MFHHQGSGSSCQRQCKWPFFSSQARQVLCTTEALCLSPQNGFSDPYVVVSNGRESHTSQVIPKTLNPEWNFSCDLTLTPDVTRISIALWDKDQFKSDFLGQISFSVAELFKSGEEQLAIGFHEKGNEVGLHTSHVRIEPACFTKLAP